MPPDDPRQRRIRTAQEHGAQACAWCRGMLNAGPDVAICQACGTLHHASCWDERGGCSIGECRNTAPREQARAHRALSLSMPVVKKKLPGRHAPETRTMADDRGTREPRSPVTYVLWVAILATIGVIAWFATR